MTYTPTPDDRNSIVVVKQMTYRGATRFFSNRYHFEGDLPVDPTHWTTLADNITTGEKAIYPSDVEIVQAIGYDKSSATLTNLHGDAVFSKDYSLAGTYIPGTGEVAAPGDCAALLRYATPARSVKNHPVYLFNYFHGVHIASGGGDALESGQKTAIEGYADNWLTGFTDGTTPRERCGPHGAVAVSRVVNSYIRHRDFPA